MLTIQVKLNISEFLTSVSGKYADGRLVSLAFGTNKHKFGPFGKTDACDNPKSTSSEKPHKKFCYNFGPSSCFEGFHGSVWNGCVYAIGIYLKPIEKFNEIPDDDDDNKSS